jgi:hypothetical protein
MLLPLLLALAPVAPLAQDGSGAEALERRPARLVTEPLESPAGSPARLSSVVRGADGRVVLTWIEEDDEGAAALRLARLGNDGWSEPSTVVRAPDLFLNWADFPAAQASADGTLLVAWLRRGEGPGLAYGVEYAVSTDGGAGWTEPVRLHNDASPVEHGFVSLAPCGTGARWPPAPTTGTPRVTATATAAR